MAPVRKGKAKSKKITKKTTPKKVTRQTRSKVTLIEPQGEDPAPPAEVEDEQQPEEDALALLQRLQQQTAQRTDTGLNQPQTRLVPVLDSPLEPPRVEPQQAVDDITPIVPVYQANPVLHFRSEAARTSYRRFLGYSNDEVGLKVFVKQYVGKPKGISDTNLVKVALSGYLDFADIALQVGEADHTDSFVLSTTGTLVHIKKSKAGKIRDWPAFNLKLDAWKKATLMFYPERAEEISDYIVNLNSFGQVPLESIVAYDEACRYKVSCHREITLDNSLSLTEAWTNHIMRGFVNNHGSRHGSHHVRPDRTRDSTEFIPICRNWNNDCCNDKNCRRRHLCLRCQGEHIIQQCTAPISGRSSTPTPAQQHHDDVNECSRKICVEYKPIC